MIRRILWMRRHRDKRGFTLIEMVVVIAIIAVLSGILVVIVFNNIEEARNARAIADVKNIVTAFTIFYKDTRTWPYSSTGGLTRNRDRLQTAAPVPTLDASWTAAVGVDTFSDYLTTNAQGYNPWKGPYAEVFDEDPWGKSYLAWVKGLDASVSTDHAWIISAGPNGTIETAVTSVVLAGDDIGVMLR